MSLRKSTTMTCTGLGLAGGILLGLVGSIGCQIQIPDGGGNGNQNINANDNSGGGVTGASLYAANCAACHGASGGNLGAASVNQINNALNNVQAMQNVDVTDEEIALIAAFLAQ